MIDTATAALADLTGTQWALLAAMALPALGAAGVLAAGRRPNLRDVISTVATLATFGAVLVLLPAVRGGLRPEVHFFEVLPGVALAFRVEPLGMLFALVASGLWILTSLYAIGYMRGHHEKHQTRFFTFFALAISAALGLAFARNLFTLFLFYEALTLSTYPLVTHHGTEAARKAGRVYLGVLLTTSIGLLLFAVLWTWKLAGTLEFQPGGILAGKAGGWTAVLLLALFAFGTGKAALMPFHRWLPAAMVAPTPVSALLHAVAVVKAGVFTILKVVIYVFGPAFVRQEELSLGLAWVAGATLIFASIIALTKDNLKARLAYSTVSQLAYIVLGALLATGSAILGGALHIAMHAMGKITLFFCAGAIYVAAHKTDISDMDGLGRRMPLTYLAFLLGAFSIIGLPPFGGAWSKFFLATGAAELRDWVFLGAYMLSSLFSIGYLMPVVARGFFLPAKAASDRPSTPPSGEGLKTFWSGVKEAPLLCVVPLCLTALGSVALFFLADPLMALLQPLAAGAGGAP